MSRSIATMLALGLFLSPSLTTAQQALSIKPLAEKKIMSLPSGPLYWRIDNFPSLADAQSASGPMALAAEAGGKAWLFSLGPQNSAVKGGVKVAEIGPLAPVDAPEYLLRVNEAVGPPGSVTPVHTHPGSEVFYVLAGQTSQKTPHGETRATAGQTMAGHGANTPMQVSSSGTADLHSLVMFVVDATKPFSSPAKLQ